MNLIGMVFKVEKLSRVDTVKGTGLTTILSLNIVPSLFLPICGVHSCSLDFKESLSSASSFCLLAEIEFLDFLKITSNKKERFYVLSALYFPLILLLNSLTIRVVLYCLKRTFCIQQSVSYAYRFVLNIIRRDCFLCPICF